MKLSQEKINEIAYAILLSSLSKQEIQLDPEQFKRKLGNLSKKQEFLPEQFNKFSKEEIQEGVKVILHDLVDYSLNFNWTAKKSKRKIKE